MSIDLEGALTRAGRDIAGDGAATAAHRLADRAAERGLLDVAYATADSPLGTLLVAVTPRGLVRLAYGDEPAEAILTELARRVSPRVLEAAARLDVVRRQLDDYFAGRRRGFELAIDWLLVGGFGRRVLQATAAIGYGSVSTYTAIAGAAGSPRGARAAGNALGANPIPVVVPCHRVLRGGGALGGYTGGVERKAFLLRLEGVPGV